MNEDREHLESLRKAHVRRLRLLELKEAQQGLDTPPQVTTEIEDLRQKIRDLDSLLEKSQPILPASDRISDITSINALHSTKVEIVLRGEFSSLTPEIQSAAIRAIAAIIDIPANYISVLKVMSGSIILIVEMPDQAAEHLIFLSKHNREAIEEIGIERVNLAIPDIEQLLQKVHRVDNSFEYEVVLDSTSGNTLYVLSRKFSYNSKPTEFQVNIYIDGPPFRLRYITPLFPDMGGLVGENIGALYQHLGEFNLILRGNIKLALFSSDESNQIIMVLARDVSELDEMSFQRDIAQLFEAFMLLYPDIERAISRLGLKFSKDARLKSPFRPLLDRLHWPSFITGDNTE